MDERGTGAEVNLRGIGRREVQNRRRGDTASGLQMLEEATHSRVAAGVTMVTFERTVNRRALHVSLEPVADLLAKGLEGRHAGAGQVRRAAELTGDHGVLRQRPRRIEPAEILRRAPYGGELLAAHEPGARYVAVGIALPHADKDLAVLKQFET